MQAADMKYNSTKPATQPPAGRSKLARLGAALDLGDDPDSAKYRAYLQYATQRALATPLPEDTSRSELWRVNARAESLEAILDPETPEAMKALREMSSRALADTYAALALAERDWKHIRYKIAMRASAKRVRALRRAAFARARPHVAIPKSDTVPQRLVIVRTHHD
jgi:hypothetical protein